LSIERIGQWHDQGVADLVLLIGGADGHGEAARQRADLVLSLGRQTWPHMLVRALVAEQLYRAQTILAGHPYHRE
jgi:23S rRNA (pseudouridine1915-N3)-methyltransferase